MDDKMYHRHTGYPGGLKSINLRDLLAKNPERVIESAVWGMLPHNRMGRHLMRKLRVYAGPDHPHDAQNPKPIEEVLSK
jgi:large subunit ribosomal protein L13